MQMALLVSCMSASIDGLIFQDLLFNTGNVKFAKILAVEFSFMKNTCPSLPCTGIIVVTSNNEDSKTSVIME